MIGLLVPLAIFASAGAEYYDSDCYYGTVIDHVYHEKEIVLPNLIIAFSLAVDYDTSTLLFSTNPFDLKSAYLNLKTNEFGIIPGIHGEAQAVDAVSSTVYLAGQDGIYTYDYNNKKAVNLNIDIGNETINQMYYKNGLYYTIQPYGLYKVVDGVPQEIQELADSRVTRAAVDNGNNIWFSNHSGLYFYQPAKDIISKKGAYNVIDFTTDINGGLYFFTSENLYFVNETSHKVITRAYLHKLFYYGIALENNGNILYSDIQELMRLHPTNKTCLAN